MGVRRVTLLIAASSYRQGLPMGSFGPKLCFYLYYSIKAAFWAVFPLDKGARRWYPQYNE
jgi:hypothetical protein